MIRSIRRLVPAAALLVAASAAVAGPRAVVELTGADLGEVARGEVVEARFEIRNAGDEVLRVLRVKPG